MLRYHSMIEDSENMLHLIENGRLQLSADVLIARMTEVIADMHQVRDADSDYEKGRVSENLARAYWHRADCYFDAGKYMDAQNDYMQVDKIHPDEVEVRKRIKQCQKEIERKGPKLFTKAPPQNVHSPKPERQQANGSTQNPVPPQGKYAKFGREGSPFMQHKLPPKSPRQKLPAETHHRLNQPGGKGGNHGSK